MGQGRKEEAGRRRQAAGFGAALGRLMKPPFPSAQGAGGPEHPAKVQRGPDLWVVTVEASANPGLQSPAGMGQVSPCSWQVAWETPFWPGQAPGTQA